MRMHLEKDAFQAGLKRLKGSRRTVAGRQEVTTMTVCYRRCGSPHISAHYFIEGGTLQQLTPQISRAKTKFVIGGQA